MGRLIVWFLLPFFFAACTTQKVSDDQKLQVEKVLKSFLELSAGATDLKDREKLRDLCSGEMRRAFQNMTDESFKTAYLNSKIKVNKIDVFDLQTKDGKIKAKYRIELTQGNSGSDVKQTNEREVEVVESRGAWLLESIRTHGADTLAFSKGMIF